MYYSTLFLSSNEMPQQGNKSHYLLKNIFEMVGHF